MSSRPGLRLFYDLAHKFNASLDLDTVLEQVIEQVNHFLNIDATSVSLLDPESKELVIQMTIGSETDPQPGLRLPPYAGIAGWVVRHKEPVLIPDVQNDPRFYPSVDQRTHFTSRSMICVPLIVQNESIGVIQAISASSGVFSQADFYFMIALADVAALHIENARLFKAEQEARQYAQVLKQIAETIGASLSLDHVLDLAMKNLQQVVPCDSIAILVMDGSYPQRLPWYATQGGMIDVQKGECLVVLAGYGFDDLDDVLQTCVQASDVPLFEQISFSKHAVTVSDTRLDGRYESWARDERVRSWLGVPLIVD